MDKLYRINEIDNVAIKLSGDSDIKVGHKVALKDIKLGEYVYKYGQIIGRAKKDIKEGEWIHSHNLESHLDQSFNYSYNPKLVDLPFEEKTFLGYKRESGRAGIRNDIYIIPTVGCVNSVVKQLEANANKMDLGSIDGVFALTHQFGCSQLGNDQENIKNLK